VYNGLPTKDLVPTKRKREEFLVWLGRFVPEKGVHLAIEAAKRAQRPIVLAGTVDRYQQASMSYFADVIKPLLDNEQVKYIGPVNQKQKISLLSRAYGFLNPIEWEEPFGMVMIEAMALGCPVISFAHGAAPELIVDGETGFLVATLDEMVERIPHLTSIDRQVTRAHVEEHFLLCPTVPAKAIRKNMSSPACKMFKAAFSSLSSTIPQVGQMWVRTERLFLTRVPHAEQS
jgi:glycosyltransferase involved in cell wall biosynthesis